MLLHPNFDPVATRLGPIVIHWYGVAYMVAFGLFLYLAHRRLQHETFRSMHGARAWTSTDLEDMLLLGVLGVVIGGRLGYCLFYKPHYFLEDPLHVLYVWQGGMSFHGGMLGVVASQLWFARTRRRPFLQVMEWQYGAASSLPAHVSGKVKPIQPYPALVGPQTQNDGLDLLRWHICR